jgi:hypothetical protein
MGSLFDEDIALGASWAFSFQRVPPPRKRPLILFEAGLGSGVIRSHPNSAAMSFKLIGSGTNDYRAAAARARLFLMGSCTMHLPKAYEAKPPVDELLPQTRVFRVLSSMLHQFQIATPEIAVFSKRRPRV